MGKYFCLDLCCPGTSSVDFAWENLRKPLRFVQRGRILLRCGSAFALSLPSLGVSSLDLGRLFTQAALFSFEHYFLSVIPGWSERPDLRCAIAHRGIWRLFARDSGFASSMCPGMSARVDVYSAAAWNGPRSPNGTAASAPARLAKSATTCANRGPRSRRRS